MVKKYFSGFTLIELLIVVSIIAILALLVINTFTGQIRKGNDAKRKADLDRIKVAVEEYEKDQNCYPQEVICTSGGTGLKPYLNVIPCDPRTHLSYDYEPDPSGVCAAWFRAYAKLENTADKSIIESIGPTGQDNYYVCSPNAPVLGKYSSDVDTDYWGCIGGVCVPIRLIAPNQPVCGPSSQTPDCYSINKCVPEGSQTWECK